MKADLTKLVGLYDCFAWVPTIKGALSLGLFGQADNILGDIDKYAIAFKNHQGFRTEHYIAATSLITVNDTKCGEDYVRTFRYIFKGCINVQERLDRFYKSKENAISDDLKSHFKHEGVLLGHLTIVTELSLNLSELEILLLKEMNELTKHNIKLHKAMDVDADSMEELKGIRKELVSKWESIENIVNKIEKDDTDKKPTFCFDVVLTRDGILLIKDVTSPEWKNLYAKADSADDYTKNVPLHRVFKMAMNYVKYLFHTNYHHNQEHDTYLPASNIHGGDLQKEGFYRIFRHQIDSFLGPVLRIKRTGFNDFTINPNGILLYARAFTKVCENNGLIDEGAANKVLEFISIQQKELEVMTQERSTILNAVLTQNNIIFLASGILAFMVAVLKVFTTFFEITKQPFLETFNGVMSGQISNEQLHILLYHIGAIVILIVIGFILYIVPQRRIRSNRFIRKELKPNWMMCNSNLITGKFSFLYTFYMKLQDFKLKYKNKTRQIIKIVVLLISLIIVIFLAYFIIKN